MPENSKRMVIHNPRWCTHCPCFKQSTIQNPKTFSLLSYDKEKQPIIPFEKMQPKNIWYFCLTNDCNDYQNSCRIILENGSSCSVDVAWMHLFCRSTQQAWVCVSTLGLTKGTLCEMNWTEFVTWRFRVISQASFSTTPSVSGLKATQHPKDVSLHLFDLQKGVKVF